MFTPTQLRHKIIKLIVNNPVKHRHTDILSRELTFNITLFFSRFKSVIVKELLAEGLINLHGDLDLFMLAKKASDTKYLHVSASITTKGMAYYRLHIEKQMPVQQEIRFKEFPQTSLRLVL